VVVVRGGGAWWFTFAIFIFFLITPGFWILFYFVCEQVGRIFNLF